MSWMARKVTPGEIKARMLDAEERCGRFLADANEAEERGEMAKAEKLFAKSRFWRDRYNRLAGNS